MKTKDSNVSNVNVYQPDGKVRLSSPGVLLPRIVENVFAASCVAAVFWVSIILILVLPKNMEATAN